MVKLMLIFVKEFLVELGGYEDFWNVMEFGLEMVMAVSCFGLEIFIDFVIFGREPYCDICRIETVL